MDDIYRYVALKCHEGLISDGRISYQAGVIDDVICLNHAQKPELNIRPNG